MKRFLSLFILMTSFLSHSLAEGRGVYINEICQSNVYRMDENMYLPDSWIELYNDSDEEIDLDGWRIVEWKDETFYNVQTFDNDQFYPMGDYPWRVRLTTKIPAKGYKIVYCDAESWGMHMFFKLSTEKNHNLAIYDDKDNLIDIVLDIPAAICPDVTYGRVEGDASHFSHFAFSTPKAPNEGAGVDLAPKVEFSQLGGVLTDATQVEISVDVDSLKDYIYYTLDGSEPTYSSSKYTSPIEVSQTTILRSRVLKEGLLPRNTQTQSYLFLDHDVDLPVMSLVTDSLWFYDDSLGIYEGNKTAGISSCGEGNYVGDRWRYVSIEYFDDLKDLSKVNQQVLVRISGACSRSYSHKGIIVKTNKRMPKSNIKYSFWKEKPQITKTKSFMLRNSGQDWHRTMFRDAAAQHLLGGKVDLDIQAYQPCVLYINGVYYGIHNIRERSDENWIKDNIGLEEEEFDFVERYTETKSGTNEEILKILEGIKDSTLAYQDVASKLDVEEFINYLILELFSTNIDWPFNNVSMWKKKDGGKWRFICKDLDFIFSKDGGITAGAPMLDYLYCKPIEKEPFAGWEKNNWDEYKTRLIRYVLAQDSFVKPFLEKSVLYLGTYLHKDSVAAVVDSFSYRIENEMYYHKNRWEGGDWYDNVMYLRGELRHRADSSYQHLTDHYGLGEPVPTYISGEEGSDIKLFNMQIPGNKFDGKLFSGMPAQLKCSPGYSWQVNYKGMDGESYAVTMPDSVEFVASPAYLDLTLTAVNIENDLQEVVNVPECQWWVSDGDLHLNAIGEPLAFAEVLSADGKCLWRGENVEQFELPLPVHQIFLLRYQTATKFGTFKIVN